MMIFKVNLVGRTALRLLDRWLGREEISVCCMKNDAGNVVSDADGMKNIWRKYMEKLLNVENDWDGEVDCPEVMGPHCLISEEEVEAAIKGLKIGKAAGPTGVVSEIRQLVVLVQGG